MKTLKLIFPGRRYSLDRSLLYFLNKYIEGDTLYFSYNIDLNLSASVDLLINEAYEYSKEKIKEIDLTKYTEIIFIGKSIGTVVAGKIRELVKLEEAKFIALTPLDETVPYLHQWDFIVTSDDDRYFSSLSREKFKYAYPFFILLKGIGHSLESNVLSLTFKIQHQIIEEALTYCDTSIKDLLGEDGCA